MARQQRVTSDTGIYHIMLRGNERKNILADREDKQRFLEDVAIKQSNIGFSLYAYCLMDNHVHILLNTNEKDLSIIMKGIAVRYAYFYNTKHRRVGHVFQDRFRSEPVEEERYLLAVIRYIHNNPVKAGMVLKAEEYPWSSYRSYIKLNPRKDELMDTQFVLDIISNDRLMAIEEFKRFSNEADDAEYLDFPDENEIRTLEDGQAFLKKYLQEKWAGQTLDDILTTNRKEVIAYFRSHTKLSVRVIAELLGVNRNVVERIRVK
ncbi:MAG: transposase [Syntrophomonas sp.]|nr:transposase [Syntrophomonas sp.]